MTDAFGDAIQGFIEKKVNEVEEKVIGQVGILFKRCNSCFFFLCPQVFRSYSPNISSFIQF